MLIEWIFLGQRWLVQREGQGENVTDGLTWGSIPVVCRSSCTANMQHKA